MILVFSWLVQSVFLIVVSYFALYVLLELRVLFISRRVERRKLTEITQLPLESDAYSPLVSVLLPVCNESDVVERLIDAVCRLSYPANALEILVLDDSSDETSALIQAKVEQYAARGTNIQVVRRQNREGYKAGNLINGIRYATGEFFAIFDADFVPPEDFLLKTMPCFKDATVGFLQTGIGYENEDASFLTRFQAMEMRHQQYVTMGLHEDGDMASLTGTSCVWRKACVEAVGGFSAATVTEDVDLGYRAQFAEWKYAWLRDVVSMSILPETVSAFRMQRERWGRGLVHGAFLHGAQLFSQRMGTMKRLNAISMMFSSVLLAAIYVLVLLSLPLSYLVDLNGTVIQKVMLAFLVLIIVWALGNAFGSGKGAKSEEKPGMAKRLWESYLYVALFLPMAWYYFVGGIRALLGEYGEFHRTPKGRDEYRSNPSRLPRINSVLAAGELVTFFYSLLGIFIAFKKGNYLLIPFNVTVCLGFGMVLLRSWQRSWQRS